MKRTTLVVLLLTLVVWSIPIKTASALLTETNIEEDPTFSQFINYEQFRENSQLHNQDSRPSNRGSVGVDNGTRQTETSGSYSGRHYSKEEVQELIKHYSAVYKIDSATPTCIAKLESGYHQFSKNKNSTASGIFQYLSSTWSQTDEGKLGFSVFDAEQNVKAAVKYMAIHKSVKPWVVWPNCPPLSFL